MTELVPFGIALAVVLAALGLWADRKAMQAKLRLACPVCCEVVEPDGTLCPRCAIPLITPERDLDLVVALRELGDRREWYTRWSQVLIVSGALLLIVSLLAEGFLG